MFTFRAANIHINTLDKQFLKSTQDYLSCIREYDPLSSRIYINCNSSFDFNV